MSRDCEDIVALAGLDGGDQEVVAVCGGCRGIRFVRNGKTGSGRQNYKCKKCGRQSDFSRFLPPIEVREITRRMLAAGLPVKVIVEITKLSRGQVYGVR